MLPTSAPPSPTRLLLVDDHAIFRAGVKAFLAEEGDFLVLGEAGTGSHALGLHRDLQPDIVLLDLRLPDVGGIELIERMKEQRAETRIVVLSSQDRDELAERALQAGASAYLSKDGARTDLVPTLRAVARGEAAQEPAIASTKTSLSAREREVLMLVAQGKSNGGVATRLGISEETVKTHLMRIFQKLGVQDRAHAVLSALRLTEISPRSDLPNS